MLFGLNADGVISNSNTEKDIPKRPKCYKIVRNFITNKPRSKNLICKPTKKKLVKTLKQLLRTILDVFKV